MGKENQGEEREKEVEGGRRGREKEVEGGRRGRERRRWKGGEEEEEEREGGEEEVMGTAGDINTNNWLNPKIVTVLQDIIHINREGGQGGTTVTN